MSTPAATLEKVIPKSATIIIQSHLPFPPGEVEVLPGGRIIFLNEDRSDYSLRFYKPGTDPASGFGVLLPANGRHTVLIAPGDVFMYEISDVDASGAPVSTLFSLSSSYTVSPQAGTGGGPIKN